MKSICAHCGKLIEESSCRAYVNERGADIEHVHRQCEAAYEAARDQRAGQVIHAPPSPGATKSAVLPPATALPRSSHSPRPVVSSPRIIALTRKPHVGGRQPKPRRP